MWSHIFFLLVDRLPLLGTRRALNQLIFIVQQQAEIIAIPLGRRRRPAAFQTRCDGIAADTGSMRAEPAKALSRDNRRFWFNTNKAGITSAMRLAESVTTSRQCDSFFVIHGHTGKSFTHVTSGQGRVGIPARAFGVHIDQAHLNCRKRVLQKQVFVGVNARLYAFIDHLVFVAPVNVALWLERVGTTAAKSKDGTAH